MTASKPLAGAVVSEQQRASDIGAGILRKGGNAADAIIATILAVNTLAPFHSDIGGGGFAIIRQADGNYEALDFRHVAPKDVTMEYYQKGASTSVGGSAVAVPGQMRGLEELHRRYGRLKWAELFEPSIKLAREGQQVCEDLRDFTTRECVPPGSDNLAGSWYETDPMYHALFKNGRVLAVGELYYRPEFAMTLEAIAEKGADAFYGGEIAKAMVDTVRERGGLMTLDDLRDYRPRWCSPISAKYRGNVLWTVPAPASGAIWLSAMGILNHFKSPGAGTVLDYHRVTEALRLAYGQRTQLGDPSFVPGLETKQKEWISYECTADRAKMLSDEHTFPPDYYKPPGVEIKEDAGTSNITAADETGLVISVTTTVGLNWGSHIMVKAGFVLNDSMDDFSVQGRPNQTGYEPTKANFVAGGKRPLSSSCPYIVENSRGEVILAGGSAGGSTIISANVQVARNVLDYGFSAREALRASRLHNQILPNVSQLERQNTHQGSTVEGFSEELAEELRSKGHTVEWVPMNRSTPCAIKFLPGPDWEPAGDPRKNDSGGSVVHP
ncbi:gamma-glutamyltranspeptidase [Naematelia encephala]|uniref:Glutathione hydrolase n=1 Tax=Naematelia encephala TaxID=71784 RepID=A0A1Y2ASM5_9TREE|nr:gamma-glutamyltranspeptidase [Naematelia encephala]